VAEAPRLPSARETARNAVGPQLNGLFGRVAGSIESYNHSPANRSSGLTRNDANFARDIQDPRAAKPGTKMIFAGIGNEQEIRDRAAFLRQHPPDGKTASRARPGRHGTGRRRPASFNCHVVDRLAS
jgi:cytochrome c2